MDTWASCQRSSDQILAEGLYALQAQPLLDHRQVVRKSAGNYLISLRGESCYIGETEHLSSRIRAQFKPRTSNFYKSYRSTESSSKAEIDSFRVQYIETEIGRKELEEFGIVNIPARLNRFQLDKRERVAKATTDTLWLEIQGHKEKLLRQGERSLWARPRSSWYGASVPSAPGVYAVYSGGASEVLYIGESSDIRKRHKTHSGTTYFSALRRHIGTDILGLTLKVVKGRARYFSADEDAKVDAFLKDCQVVFLPVSFGRAELEESLITKHRPVLNRKGKAR
jgi:predicted GIY-YIG superfamily endonuclease